MKRYRIKNFDFDSRATFLKQEIKKEWNEELKNQWIKNKEEVKRSLMIEYGDYNFEQKIKNFIYLSPSPISIIAFHNKFYSQVRNAFVIGSYYPALTGACSLGERILNHLILTLRDDYKSTPEYKKVYDKKSFNDWSLPIETLSNWGILLPDVVKKYLKLQELRNRKAIHFNPLVETKDSHNKKQSQ
jgi:hypothetical protein